MPTYSVRCIFRWTPRPDQAKRHLYEERITVWTAPTLDEAIELAEAEADAYADEHEVLGLSLGFCGLSQGFWMFEDLTLPRQGVEVFSLLRESDLEPREYLATFFDTGFERQGDYEGK